MKNVLSVALGGALGSVLRYAVSLISIRYAFQGFPVGTFFVNIVGAFCIGLLGVVFDCWTCSESMRLFLFVGLLGGFTTFSSFGLETFQLWRLGETKIAVMYVLLTNFLGLGCVFLGVYFARYLLNLMK